MANEVNEVTQETVAAPQSPTEEAFGTENKGFSFDKVIFGDQGEGEGVQRGTPQEIPTPSEIPGVHTNQPTEAVPEQGQPAPEEYQAKNDDKRFEYWQSRASKLENQIKETQPLVEYVQSNPQILQQPAPQGAPPAEEPVEQFPDAPEKPERPLSYSRELSYTDPNSESARYDTQVEEWRDNMDEYRSLKHQYDNALVREKFEKVEKDRERQVKYAQAQQKQQEKASEIGEYVQANYGLDAEETGKFMQDMSSPDSISMENLVTLWRMNNGKSAAPPASTPGLNVEAPAGQQRTDGPSPTFQQTQRAQQVPQPMGVVAGQGSSNPDDGKTDGEKFMASLVGNYNDNKIF